MLLKTNKKRCGGRTLAKRLVCLGLCLAIVSGVIGVWNVPTEAAGGLDVSDYYMLTVSTGEAPGKCVQYFRLRYLDDSGEEHSTVILPHSDNTMRAGFALAAKQNVDLGNSEKIEEQTGYSVLCDYRTGFERLRPYSYDQYLFRDYFGIKELLSIDVFMEYGDPVITGYKNEWTCNGISLYQVNRLYGCRMVGFAENYTIDFDGTLLGTLHKKQENAGDFALEGASEVFRINSSSDAASKDDPYEIITSGFKAEYRSEDKLKNLIFRLDFADEVGAGIEELAIFPQDRTELGNSHYRDFYATGTLQETGLQEALTIHVRYLDQGGNTREAYLPVYTMFIGFLSEYDPDVFSNTLDMNGFAQQGDTVAFEATLPDFESLVSYSLIYGENAASVAGLQNVMYDVASTSERISEFMPEFGQDFVNRINHHKSLLAKGESMAYTGLSIYDASVSRTTVSMDGAMVRCSVEGTPLYYYKAKSTSGQSQSVGTEKSVTMTAVQPDSTASFSLLPKDSKSAYIVEITTDSIPNAATTEELQAELKYMDHSGSEKITKTYNIRDAVAEYVGFWPYDGTVGEKTNLPYMIGTASGGKLTFAVNANDVDYFTGIILTIGKTDDNVDEWQMKSVAIYRVASMPQRSCGWLNEPMTADTATTDRLMARALRINDREQYCTQKVLLNKDINSITITFDTTGGGKTEEGDVNWEEIKESMSIYEAMQDLGFIKARYQYEVNVEVKSNSNASDDYGDCGSNNKFYFQLVFEDGSSGYVQANQQLTADGFRAGRVETFIIATNRDYGELKAVHIIPDDMLEGNDIYDKLNIDNIEIVMLGTGGLSRSWRIDNVGWIDIDYKDDGAQNTNGGQRLRSEAELTSNYLINSQGYCMNFMVAVGTGEYATSGQTLKGTITATITYVDSTGTKTKTIDVAEAIADYAKKTTMECTTHGQDGDLGGKNRRWIDPTYMFRENHVDRFVISLSDVKKIKNIKFNTIGSEDCRWTIKSVDVYQIIEDGPLLFNANNEYQRDAKLEHLTGDTGTTAGTVEVQYNKTVPCTVELEDNTITVDTEQWETVIERVPSTNNDTLNLYVYLSKDKPLGKTDVIKARITYLKRDADRDSSVTATELTYSKEKGVLYGLGINTAKLKELRQLSLSSSETASVDYALIQHVRSGVVIATYYFDFGDGQIKGQGLSMPANPMKKNSKDAQVVSLSFGPETVNMDLIPEEQDIAVAITYTTTNDLAEVLYESGYIYLTDQQVKKISAGAVVDITFNEAYVKEIKKITLAGIGDITASVNKIMVITYSADENGMQKIDEIYGITDTTYVTRGARTRAVSDDSLALLEMTFNNVQQEETNNGYASMDIYVTTADGTEEVVKLTNLEGYTVSGSLLNGGTATVRVMLENVKELRYVKVQTHDTLATAPVKWYISSVNGYSLINGTNTKFAQMVKETVGPDGLYINLGDPYLSVSAKLKETADDGAVFSRDTNTKDLNKTTQTHSNSLDMAVTKGRYLMVAPSVKNALPGAEYKVTLTHLTGEEHGKLVTVGSETRFVLEGDPTGTETYRIEITSEQCPDHILTLNVTVQLDN